MPGVVCRDMLPKLHIASHNTQLVGCARPVLGTLSRLLVHALHANPHFAHCPHRLALAAPYGSLLGLGSDRSLFIPGTVNTTPQAGQMRRQTPMPRACMFFLSLVTILCGSGMLCVSRRICCLHPARKLLGSFQAGVCCGEGSSSRSAGSTPFRFCISQSCH